MEAFYIVAGLTLLVIIWLIGTYNGLVRMRNHCREAWSDIDTELKRRHELIPNLVATVKVTLRTKNGFSSKLLSPGRGRPEPEIGSLSCARQRMISCGVCVLFSQ